MRECVICGRTLRTGRKYCYEHKGRGYSRDYHKPSKPFSNPTKVILMGIVLWVGYVISYTAWFTSRVCKDNPDFTSYSKYTADMGCGYNAYLNLKLLSEWTFLIGAIIFFIVWVLVFIYVLKTSHSHKLNQDYEETEE